MTLNTRLRTRLNQTVTVNAYTGVSAYGDATFSTSVTTYVARWEPRQHRVVDTRGQDVLSRGLVYVGPTTAGVVPAINVRDKVTLPDNTTPALLAVEPLRDRVGTNHVVLHYG